MVRMVRVQAKPDSRAGVETKRALELMTIPTRYRHTVVDSYYETEVSVMCEYIFAVGLDSFLCSKHRHSYIPLIFSSRFIDS